MISRIKLLGCVIETQHICQSDSNSCIRDEGQTQCDQMVSSSVTSKSRMNPIVYAGGGFGLNDELAMLN